jgi:hypothetical protein
MGAVGLHGASAAMEDSAERVRVADVGWQTWQPWKNAAIGLHLLGSLSLLWGNKSRVSAQRGALTTTIAKTSVFAMALGADLYAAELGRRIGEQQPVSVDSAVDPSGETPDELAATQRQLRIVQWVVPALVGLGIVLGSKMGEQQRPTTVASGVWKRLDPRS